MGTLRRADKEFLPPHPCRKAVSISTSRRMEIPYRDAISLTSAENKCRLLVPSTLALPAIAQCLRENRPPEILSGSRGADNEIGVQHDAHQVA